MGDYWWAEEVVAVTVTWVNGLDLRQVGDLLGFVWPSERLATFSEAEGQLDYDTEVYAIQVAEVGDWLVMVEPNGYLSSRPQTVEPLSRGGTAVSVFWNVNAVMSVAVARGGKLVREFDPLLFDAASSPGRGDRPPAELDLAFGQDGSDPRALALEFAARLTGAGMEPAWLLEGTRRTWSAAGPAER